MSDLSDFVLNCYRQVGGIVEPPRYGVHEVLLPDAVAQQLGLPAYQRLAFDDSALAQSAATEEEATRIGYGHPFLDVLTEAARARPACARAYINTVRLEKRGLLDLARNTFVLPNARMVMEPQQSERTGLAHYVRFNFKAALITDEKREQLVSVVMDVQAGWAVPELIHVERLATLADEPAFDHLSPAPLRWRPEGQPLASSEPPGELTMALLVGLLERATRAALEELAVPLEALRRRSTRYLELDRARLTQYYGDITHDLERRIARASDQYRRDALEEKLIAAQAEREVKLADAEAKHRLRVELQLINLLVIAQPKLLLPLRVENRTARVTRTLVWDPLLRRLEPLLCDVCGRAATRLVLCNGGHLVHEDCLLPQQCVDCKRVYCQSCADQMTTCVVCERAVCILSLNHCSTCGRGTCREHTGLCHAANGQPARLTPPEPPPPPVEEKDAPLPPQAEPPDRPAVRPQPPKPTGRRAARPPIERPHTVTSHRIEVQVEPDEPVVTAFVLTKGWKNVAARSWALVENGIAVTCECEKGWGCPSDGLLLMPEDAAHIEAQIEAEVSALRQEYHVTSRRVRIKVVMRGAPRTVPRLVLRGQWKDEQVLAAARAGFAKARSRR